MTTATHRVQLPELALAVCLASSVTVLPGALNAFTLPKLAAAAAGGALALLVPTRWSFPRPVLACLGVAALCIGLSMAFSAHPLLALVGPEPRYPGLVSLLPYLGLGMAGATLLGPGRKPSSADLLTNVLSACAAAVALIAALEHLGLRPLASDVARPGSLLGNASDQGQWGLLALGPLLLLAWDSRKPIPIVGTVCAGAVIAMSGSRAALLGELAVALAVLVLRGRREGGRLVVVPLLLAVAALAVPGVAARVTGASPLAQRTATGRTLLWQETLSLTTHHPLGVGPGGFEQEIPAEHDRQWALRVGPATPTSSPESWPLELLAVGGILLLAAGLALTGLTAQAGWRQRADPLMAGLSVGLTGYATALLFAAVSPGPACLATLWGGALLATAGSRPRSRRLAIPLALASLALVVAATAEIALRAGVVAASRGQVAIADQDFRRASMLRPWDPSVALQAGHALAAASDKDKAAAAPCVRWLGGGPTTIAALIDRATCAEAGGDLRAAAALLERAAALDPSNALIALRRGVVAAEQQRLAAAERLFREAADLAPTSPDPWADLAELYRVSGQQEKQRQAAAEAARRR